jgi:hypothetical protein
VSGPACRPPLRACRGCGPARPAASLFAGGGVSRRRDAGRTNTRRRKHRTTPAHWHSQPASQPASDRTQRTHEHTPAALAASLSALMREDLPLLGSPSTIMMDRSGAAPRSRRSHATAASSTWCDKRRGALCCVVLLAALSACAHGNTAQASGAAHVRGTRARAPLRRHATRTCCTPPGVLQLAASALSPWRCRCCTAACVARAARHTAQQSRHGQQHTTTSAAHGAAVDVAPWPATHTTTSVNTQTRRSAPPCPAASPGLPC